MTPLQIMLVQQSLAKILPIKEQVAVVFYGRLFDIDPGTRELFRGDMAAQRAKLMAAIVTVVRYLDRLDLELEEIRALARRHVHYGVTGAH